MFTIGSYSMRKKLAFLRFINANIFVLDALKFVKIVKTSPKNNIYYILSNRN